MWRPFKILYGRLVWIAVSFRRAASCAVHVVGLGDLWQRRVAPRLLALNLASGHPHVYYTPAIVGVDELVSALPFPFLFILFSPLAVYVWYETGNGDPEKQADYNYGAHYIVLQKLEDRVDVEVVDKVPDPLHHILHRPFTLALQ